MLLAELIREAYQHNGVVVAYVFGDFGTGKTSYALWTAYEVLGDWSRVLNYLFFDPSEAMRVIESAVYSGKRLPIIIMDDAGLWLDKMTWWEESKVAFMEFFNLIRSVAAGVIFTTPVEDLPKAIAKKCFFRVSVTPCTKRELRALEVPEEVISEVDSLIERFGLKRMYAVATGYRLKKLPSFATRVRKNYYDVYPLHYPVFDEYEEKRRKAVIQYFEKWRAKMISASKRERIEHAKAIAAKMIAAGASKREVAKVLRSMGLQKSTAYYIIKQVQTGGGHGDQIQVPWQARERHRQEGA